MPTEVGFGSGVTTSDGTSLLVVGGYDDKLNELASIFSIQCSNKKCQWNKMEQELQAARRSPTAMLIPDTMVACTD